MGPDQPPVMVTPLALVQAIAVLAVLAKGKVVSTLAWESYRTAIFHLQHDLEDVLVQLSTPPTSEESTDEKPVH